MTTPANMQRIESFVAELPEAERVDIEKWGDHPTFRVRGKNFVFCKDSATQLWVKLSKEEAAAVIATDDHAKAAGHGLGRHGWIAFELPRRPLRARWEEVGEWIRTNYTLIASKLLARIVLAEEEKALSKSPDRP
ncbi:MAG: MmcQ/YjbR family DNA-binding protein [Acidimicrobiia bacterium]|nr:MmcQ/YjbR family DNA-binding protein [Acidimicrobiia bacterium]